jgi:ATP-dependent RNA helicase RhlE
MSVFAEVLQYRPFRRVFPSAGAGCILPCLHRVSCGTPWLRFILMPFAAPAAAAPPAQAHF